MKYGSVCSGVEAATVAWHPLGWEPQWFAEVEPFPSAVLNHHYPTVPNLGDMTKLDERDDFNSRAIDLLVGGTPCQAFSVAGLRAGLADERGNLSLEFVRLLALKRPRWFLWKNVPGVLSSSGGADFASILSAWTGTDIAPQKFTKSGIIQGEFYSIAWRVLDAQHFGVAQRRRRVFVVGHLGNDWRPSAAVLFERDSLRGNPEKGGEKRQKATRKTTAGIDAANCFQQNSRDEVRLMGGNGEIAGALMAEAGAKQTNYVAPTSEWWNGGQLADTLTRTSDDQRMPDKGRMQVVVAPLAYSMKTAQTGSNGWGIQEEKTHTLDCAQGPAVCSFKAGQGAKAGSIGYAEEISPTLTAAQSGSNMVPTIHSETIARRLTPVECERLQGFPDNYTSITYKGKPAPITARYKAMGNSMAVPVMHWIGERINRVNKLICVK